MNDIHYENLIQKGEYPIIIDTETLVSYKNYSWLELSSAEEQSMQKIYFDFLSNTVLDTFMLPYKLEAITFDVDISPLSIYEEQKSNHMGGYKIVDEFSDDIRFEYQEFCTQAESVQHNPFCFLDDIVTGFEYTYNWFISNKKFYIQTVMELLSKYRVKVRQVLRATYVYAKFLDATTHPDYLVDETKLLQLLEKMIPKNKENYFRIWQGEMEVKSLLENDIPYFYTYIDENALYCDYGKIENYFDITIWDVITNKLSSLSEHDLERQKSMILLSMSMLGRTNLKKVNIAENSPSAVKYTTDYFSKKDIISEILRFITDKSIWNLEKNMCFWIGHVNYGENVKIGVLSYYLYEGGGILLPLAYVEQTGRKYEKVIRAAMISYEKMNNGVMQLSAYNGIGSLLYLYYMLGNLWDDDKYKKNYQLLLQRILSQEIGESQQIDYCNGLSGMAVLLENIYMREREEAIIPVIQKYVDYCLEHIDQIELAGLAHGYSGIALATSGLYSINGDKKYKDATISLVNKENRLYCSDISNWKDLRYNEEEESDSFFWCHGAAGIGLSRMKMYQNIGDDALKIDMQRAVKKIVRDMNKLENHSLCHGMFGNLDILNSICCSGLVSEECLSQKDLKRLQNEIIEDILSKGCICGMANAYNMLSFMQGISGMAYAMERMKAPNLPNILLLEL